MHQWKIGLRRYRVRACHQNELKCFFGTMGGSRPAGSLSADQLPGSLQKFSYALHLILLLGLPVGLFWEIGDRDPLRDALAGIEFIPNEMVPDDKPPAPYAQLPLRQFVSTGSGLVFTAPDT